MKALRRYARPALVLLAMSVGLPLASARAQTQPRSLGMGGVVLPERRGSGAWLNPAYRAVAPEEVDRRGQTVVLPLGLLQIIGDVPELDPDRRTVVYCAGGYRSSVAASLMRKAGFGEVADIDGGWGAWTARAGAAV